MMAAITGYILGLLFLGALTIVVFKLVVAFRSYNKKKKLYGRFQQTPGSLIFGNLFDYPGPDEKGLAWQRELTAKYPRSVLLWLMQIPMVLTNHPDTVKVILKSSEPKGRLSYDLIRPWIGDGLLTSAGAKWARYRRLLTPAFHFEILKNYIELKNRCADLLVQKFERASKEPRSFPVCANVTMFTLDVILRSAMSYETDCQKLGERHPYVLAVNSMSELIVKRFLRPWFYSDFIYYLTPSGRKFRNNVDLVHQVADDIIKKRKEKLRQETLSDMARGEKRRRGMDFLDILLTARDENGEGLTDAEIREEVDTVLFAGHDTTASAISWALYSIAEHQDVQQRIQEELDGLMAGRSSEDILWEDLPEMPYLTMVIKECLRLHSPVPIIQRELTTDMEIDGKIVPAGTLLTIPIYNVHHNPTIWEDTLKFDPDRFLPENVEKRSAYAFVPFSAGPRNCIGQNFAMDEIKIALARILHRFTLKLDSKCEVAKVQSLVMRTQEEMRLLVKKRQ